MTEFEPLIVVRAKEASPVVDDATTMRERWRAESMSAVWLRPGDWYCPEVDAVIDAIVDGRDPTAALERLGAARCEAGVGLGETLDDLICLFGVSGREHAPWTHIRVVAEAWSEVLMESTAAAPYVDPTSALVSIEYLRLRLGEIYAEASYRKQSVGDRYCLVVVDTAVGNIDHWRQLQRSFTLSAALHEVFTHGETMATVAEGSGCAIVLARRNAALAESLGELREAILRNMDDLYRVQAARQPARIWVESLPDDVEVAAAMLSTLAR